MDHIKELADAIYRIKLKRRLDELELKRIVEARQ